MILYKILICNQYFIRARLCILLFFILGEQIMSDTIRKDGILPSNGKIYTNLDSVNPNIVVRSMTTNDEMKRLNTSASPYKNLAEVLDGCCVEKDAKLHAYDMWMPDFQYLMLLVRIATYGSNMITRDMVCPHCQHTVQYVQDLRQLLPKNIEVKSNKIILPISNSEIEVNYETPRLNDRITRRTKEMNDEYGKVTGQDFSMLVTMEEYIKSIDGQVLPIGELRRFIKDAPMADTNFLMRKIKEFNDVGFDGKIVVECPDCEKKQTLQFLMTNEFFRPTV